MAGSIDVLTNFHTLFLSKELTIPAIQMVYFLGLINILMLMRYYRVTYLISLIFSLYWLVVLNQDKFGPLASDTASNSWVLMGGGLVLLILALFCFLAQSEN
jgi:hypothetical protein